MSNLHLYTRDGSIIIKMRLDLAPKHIERIVELAKRGFYDGVPFHRVIEGFMAQTGDPSGTGQGGADLSGFPDLKAEFSDAPFKRGTVGMARANDPDSGNCQFFICFAPAPQLNGQYTVWGEVVDGMENVDKIKCGEPPGASRPDHRSLRDLIRGNI